MVLKLEREVYGTSRPRQLAKRDVFLRIGDPIDLGRFVPCYFQDPQAVRRRVEEQLRDMIQNLIDAIISRPARAELGPNFESHPGQRFAVAECDQGCRRGSAR